MIDLRNGFVMLLACLGSVGGFAAMGALLSLAAQYPGGW